MLAPINPWWWVIGGMPFTTIDADHDNYACARIAPVRLTASGCCTTAAVNGPSLRGILSTRSSCNENDNTPRVVVDLQLENNVVEHDTTCYAVNVRLLYTAVSRAIDCLITKHIVNLAVTRYRCAIVTLKDYRFL